MDKLRTLDTELFLFLNSQGVSAWDNFWLFVTTPKTWIALYIIFVLCIYLKERNLLKTIFIVLLLATLVGINDGLSNIAKHFFERPRPCRSPEVLASSLFRMVAPYCGHFGYYSAHAANHFAMALFLGIYFKPIFRGGTPLLLLWATVIAYSRIYIGVHYPLDILTGALVGSISAYLFVKILYPFLYSLFWKKKV